MNECCRKWTGIMAAVAGMAVGLLADTAFAEAKYKIKMGYVVPESYPHHIAARDVFKPFVEEKSGGRISVELYPNGQLGGDRQLIESVQIGTVQMALPSLSPLTGFAPKFKILDLPFLFNSKEHAYKVLDGKIGRELSEGLIAKGMRNLGFAEIGFQHITNKRNAIHDLEGTKGLKLRIQESPVTIASIRAMGSNPTTVSFGEVYTALQQGVVDGQVQCIAVIGNMKFYEVQKYLTLADLSYSAIAMLINDDFFTGLPKDLQAVLVEGAVKFREAQRKIVAEQEKAWLGTLKEKGMEINTLTAVEKRAFVEIMKPVYDQFRKEIGADMIDAINAAGN